MQYSFLFPPYPVTFPTPSQVPSGWGYNDSLTESGSLNDLREEPKERKWNYHAFCK